jgi:hypothetical protein
MLRRPRLDVMQPCPPPGPLILGPVPETGRPLAPSVDPGRWLGTFDELTTRAGARFSRVEPRRRAWAFVLGLLAELPRKNCRTIAEHAGDRTSDAAHGLRIAAAQGPSHVIALCQLRRGHCDVPIQAENGIDEPVGSRIDLSLR